jgi:hypothetical protein
LEDAEVYAAESELSNRVKPSILNRDMACLQRS